MILCCGEALIDMVPEGDGTFRPLPGGAVYNSAVGLGRLGAKAGFLWPISRDPFGAMLLAPLHEAGVDVSLCPRSDRPTTLAVVTLNRGEARYDFYEEGTAGRLFAPADLPAATGATALLIGGISLVNDPCGAAVETLVRREAGRVPVYLDPNVRAFFITDAEAHRARLLRLMRAAAIVKLSADDLGWVWHGLSPEDAAAATLALGPRLVLTTAGAEGATAWRRGHAPVSVPAERVSVVDTIGAGDSFNAGVLAGLQSLNALSLEALARIGDGALRGALGRGTRAAAVTVSRAGANPPWARELR